MCINLRNISVMLIEKEKFEKFNIIRIAFIFNKYKNK